MEANSSFAEEGTICFWKFVGESAQKMLKDLLQKHGQYLGLAFQ